MMNMNQPKVDIKYTKMFINNEWTDAVSKKTMPVTNPSTGKSIAQVAEGDKPDIDKAVQAAKMAFSTGSEWRMMDASKRGHMMMKLADLMERDIKELAMMESMNNGKPVDMAMIDMQLSVNTMRYYAGWADKIHGDTIPSDGPLVTMTVKEPVGVVGQIIPWTYPVLMLVWKWGPALATGCTIVMKPAEQTPLTALMMAALAKEAGFPKGVINVVTGMGPTAGHALAMHPDVMKIAFTGSNEVGHLVMEAAAKSNLKKVTLELGGKSPMVVFDDVNVDEAVAMAHKAVFMNQGQTCCGGTRTFVHEKIYDEFVKKATEMAKARKVGNPFDNGVQQGPQVDQETLDKITKMVETGKKEGAKLMTGGKRIGTTGYFFEPTVFADVTDNMTIAKEEIFGPVQAIMKFSKMEEVIRRANMTHFGLAAGVMTNDINRAMMFTHLVKAGTVWVNTYNYLVPQMPFGGYKESGMGRDLGKESLEEYLETKSILIQMPKKMTEMMKMMTMNEH
ncbi:unnamed protein product [Phyllotreta striolata]|uniref:Aldehyde dehydrogenase domain-containing protein n=1 Tax=Phyllotreta striolata TaxID=444603 RepID=A0A9N9TMX2_PHYSR|nr:unnamed protein product [Phyllotreta striolata]